MNIAVYSGSFNPLHIGHLAIIRHMIDEAGFDCVYLIVSPKNPLKDSISSDSGRKRFEAAKEAVARHFHNDIENRDGSEGRNPSEANCGKIEEHSLGKVYVDDIELNMPEPHYTIRTLDALSEREPGNKFTLVIGADNLAGIRRWRDYRRILTDYGAAVFPRQGYDLEQIREDLLTEDPSYLIYILEADMVNISSSAIREAEARGEDMSGWMM